MRAPRRHFLFGSLAAAAGLPARSSTSANDTVTVGFMGVRGRGNSLIGYFAKRPDVEIAYLADVDARLLPGRAAEVESLRGQRAPDRPGFPARSRRQARRRTCDRHARPLARPGHVWACQAGKDVYVEKPTSHSIWESRKMVEAARKHGRVVQVGAQCRSAPMSPRRSST